MIKSRRMRWVGKVAQIGRVTRDKAGKKVPLGREVGEWIILI
jgi:hypothetical protein